MRREILGYAYIWLTFWVGIGLYVLHGFRLGIGLYVSHGWAMVCMFHMGWPILYGYFFIFENFWGRQQPTLP